MAAAQLPWKNVNTADIQHAVVFKQACSWKFRSEVALQVASNAGEDINVRAMAIHCLVALLQSSECAEDEQEHEKRTARVCAFCIRLLHNDAFKTVAARALKSLRKYVSAVS